MKARKTFLTAATAVTLAIAGTSVASAQEELPDDASTGSSASNEDSGSAPTAGSAELSAERDVFGSVTGADALGSWTGDQFDYGKATEALVSLAVGGAARGDPGRRLHRRHRRLRRLPGCPAGQPELHRRSARLAQLSPPSTPRHGDGVLFYLHHQFLGKYPLRIEGALAKPP